MPITQCEGNCGQSLDDTAISFKNMNTGKDVAWHRKCYAKKFGAPHVLLTEEDRTKFYEGKL